MTYRLGAHIPSRNSAARQRELGADIAQITLGSPRKWEDAKVPIGDVASPIYVHAPYLVNLSAARPILLERSIKCLVSQADMAAELGALGLVVHGGSWKKSEMNLALIQWANALSREWPLPILIEISASGEHSLTRYPHYFSALWKEIGGADREDIGWCMDTAHLWAASEEPDMQLTGFLEELGPPSLVHANGSAALLGSRMDRHSPWKDSTVKTGKLVNWIIRSECQDIIAETKDPEADLPLMREMLS